MVSVSKKVPRSDSKSYVLVGDIGGTNTTLALCDNTIIIHKEHFATKHIKDFVALVHDFLKRENIHKEHLKGACFGVAGPVIDGVAKLSNGTLKFDQKHLETKLQTKTYLLNDFVVLGYATNILSRKERIVLREGHEKKHAPRVILGAGTGLGKSLLIYDSHIKSYLPQAGELAHTDLPLHSEDDLRIANYIRQTERVHIVTYEHVVSGSGLERLYLFHANNERGVDEENLFLPAHRIMDKTDSYSRAAITDFVRFFARACRNEAIDACTSGGIFLAGGIVTKNPHIFGREFVHEFTRHDKKSIRNMLCDIPITLITDYDVSLRGCAHAFDALNERVDTMRNAL